MTETIDTTALRSLVDRDQIRDPNTLTLALCDEVDRLRMLNESGVKMIRALTDELVKAGAERDDAQRERNGWRTEAWRLTGVIDKGRDEAWADRAALERVRALHFAMRGGVGNCAGCGASHPCRTIRAIAHHD